MSNNLKAAVLIGLSIVMTVLAAATTLLFSASLAEAETLALGSDSSAVALTLPNMTHTTSVTATAGTFMVDISSTQAFNSASTGGISGSLSNFTVSPEMGATFTDLNFTPFAEIGLTRAIDVTATGSNGVPSNTIVLGAGELAVGFALTFSDPTPLTSVTIMASPFDFDLVNHLAISGLAEAPPPEIPLPAALPLFATGLGGLGLFGWRGKRRAKTVA